MFSWVGVRAGRQDRGAGRVNILPFTRKLGSENRVVAEKSRCVPKTRGLRIWSGGAMGGSNKGWRDPEPEAGPSLPRVGPVPSGRCEVGVGESLVGLRLGTASPACQGPPRPALPLRWLSRLSSGPGRGRPRPLAPRRPRLPVPHRLGSLPRSRGAEVRGDGTLARAGEGSAGPGVGAGPGKTTGAGEVHRGGDGTTLGKPARPHVAFDRRQTSAARVRGTERGNKGRVLGADAGEVDDAGPGGVSPLRGVKSPSGLP